MNFVKPDFTKTPWKYFRDKKQVLRVYMVLRLLVIVTLVWQILEQNYQNAFICVLTLVLFLLPSMIERKLKLELPDALEIVILLFIFAADILGEIQEYYVLVPHWDTVLHTVNGFLFAAIGFCIVNILNENKKISLTLSPFYMAVAAFCFSMTIGVLWEFFEWGCDCLFGLDMQKDTVIHALRTVELDPTRSNKVVAVRDIQEVILVHSDGTQQVLGLGGYLDMGLHDTMKDLIVNFIGATVFSIIGFFYVRAKGQGRFAARFIPRVLGAEQAQKNDM